VLKRSRNIDSPYGGWVVPAAAIAELWPDVLVANAAFHASDLRWKQAAFGPEGIEEYVERLRRAPEFGDWDAARYFDIEVRGGADLDIRLRAKRSLTDHDRKRYTVMEAIKKERRCVILGDPGSGKTTALKRLTLTFADEFAADMQSDHTPAGSSALRRDIRITYLPIYVWLPRFNSVVGPTTYDRFLRLIYDAIQRLGITLSRRAERELVKHWRLALLLDGFNEVGENSESALLDGLRTFAQLHEHHIVVLASRSYNFEAMFAAGDLPVFELVELSYPDDIREYASLHLHDQTQVEHLMQLLAKKPQFRRLTVNPLLLLMVILVFVHEGNIPNSRGQLLDKIARGLLGRWEMTHMIGSVSRYWEEDKHILLRHLANTMKSKGLELTEELAVKSLDEAVVERAAWFSEANSHRPPHLVALKGQVPWPEIIDEMVSDRILLRDEKHRVIRFWHQTLQEYFAAWYLLDHLEGNSTRYPEGSLNWQGPSPAPARKLSEYIADPGWHEILGIASGLVQTKSSRESHPTAKFIDDIWRKNRALAAVCFSNIEHYDDPGRLDVYVRSIRRRVTVWGIDAPRLYPWLLLGVVAVAVWVFTPALASMGRHLFAGSSRIQRAASVRALVGALTGIGGTVAALLFFRLYAYSKQELEAIWLERFVRPDITALRLMHSDAADRLLAQLSARVGNDFSIGDRTRALFLGGRAIAPADETEAILMLGDEYTRLQAIERLSEFGTGRALVALHGLLADASVDNLSYASAVRELVWHVKMKPGQSQGRAELVAQLIQSVNDPSISYAKRLQSWRGLDELGTRLPPPTRGLLLSTVTGGFPARAVLVVLGGLLVLMVALLLATR
jgi:hypothetical protein